jgi:ABC-type sugar transport system substrate-binding protein
MRRSTSLTLRVTMPDSPLTPHPSSLTDPAMPTAPNTGTSRRDVLVQLTAGLGLGSLLAGCGGTQPQGEGPAGGRRRLRALVSNAGLQGTWNKVGRDAAQLWCELLDIDMTFVDGEFDVEKQVQRIDGKVDQEWDFVAIQAHQMNTLEASVSRLAKRKVPVISMDTLIVDRPRLREAGVWLEIAPNHCELAEKSTQYLVDKIGGKGSVIHIGGESAHSGAQDRKRGFDNVLKKYPEVKVVGGGVRWCDWKVEKARDTFETLLEQPDAENVAGAFVHNDDMALACSRALEGKPKHKGMVITAVDGQKTGLDGVKEGRIAATAVNPASMVHMYPVVVGQFIVRNREKMEDLPLQILLPSTLVSKESGNLDAMYYLSDPRHGLV